MRFGLSAKAVADVNDVKTGLIRTRRIVFTPTMTLKEELANTAINITCYDRNGEVVKRVTSADPGTVEEPEQGDDNGTGENGGSSSETQSLAAPVISGNTPFAETTTVSMSGPDGAEIHYTTDGSNPTAESQLYSEPFTLSASANVKAIAIKDGNSSQVTTKDFTKTNGGDSNDYSFNGSCSGKRQSRASG